MAKEETLKLARQTTFSLLLDTVFDKLLPETWEVMMNPDLMDSMQQARTGKIVSFKDAFSDL